MSKRGLCQGKRKDNGKWIEGYYVCIGEKHHFIFTGEIAFIRGNVGAENYEVDGETLRRNTFAADMNGVDIYEGDIVCFNGRYGEIVYNAHIGCFELETDSEYFPISYHDEFEVRGNIYDDSYFLEGGEKR